MVIEFQDGVLDYELEFLEELLAVMDARIERVSEEATTVPDPDAWGHLDHLDAAAGLGFVACQQYMSAIAGWFGLTATKNWKQAALAQGPIHSSGARTVALINAGANYWKHHEEWTLPGGQDKLAERTLQTLEATGIRRDQSYLAFSLLAELVRPPRLSALLSDLIEWREVLRANRSYGHVEPPCLP